MTAPLEQHFLAKFTPHGDGLLYAIAAGGVVYSHAEVEEFVRYRQRAWANPFVWGLFVIGLVVAVALWFSGGAYGREYGALVAVLSTLPLVLLLINAEAQPTLEAATRPIIVPAKAMPPPGTSLLGDFFRIALGMVFAFGAFRRHDLLLGWAFVALVAVLLALLVMRGWKAWKAEGA